MVKERRRKEKQMKAFRLPIIFCSILLALALISPAPVPASDIGGADVEILKGLYPGKAYSPYAKRSFPSRVFWGETHLHTGLSLDAGLFGNVLMPEEAYRFARGEEVKSSTGQPVKLSRPLDWLVVTDHTDMMGIATDIQNGAPNIMANPKGKEWAEGFAAGGETAGKAAFDLITHFAQEKIPEEFLEQYAPGSPIFTKVWEKIIDAAEQFNEPGRFTALIGFEWTSVPKGYNLHRNVVLRDGGERARQVAPLTTQPPVGTQNPLDLYKWLEDYETKTGGQALALAHNGNMSNGWMFPMVETYFGGKVDKNYVELRAKWEPLYEVTQIKGDGEAHPYLSPTDEFADYETWEVGNLDITALKEESMFAGEYAREALKNGLVLEEKLGTNPYKFGMVGATDSHTSLATGEEDNFFGKSVSTEPSATRIAHPFVTSELGSYPGYSLVASGYQGIWATENTREALFDAMERKETYATTGPRTGLRRLPEGRPHGRRFDSAPLREEGTDLHDLRPPRSHRRQSRPRPDHQGLGRQGRQDPGEDLRRRRLRRPHHRGGRPLQDARRQHRRHRGGELDQHHRRLGARHGLDGGASSRSRRPAGSSTTRCASARRFPRRRS
jgi:hypothetical protein